VAMGLIFFSKHFDFPCQYHTTSVRCSFVYNLGDGQWAHGQQSHKEIVLAHPKNSTEEEEEEEEEMKKKRRKRRRRRRRRRSLKLQPHRTLSDSPMQKTSQLKATVRNGNYLLRESFNIKLTHTVVKIQNF
jgi:hypothetical protein